MFRKLGYIDKVLKQYTIVLTSSQAFPKARRGYSGAFGLANTDTGFEIASSLGCNVITIIVINNIN